MAANIPFAEEIAIAGPATMVHGNFVVAVLAMEGDVQAIDLHTIAFAGVDFRLLDFANET